MDHLSEVLQIMDGAWHGDQNKVERYAELLATKLESDGEYKQAKHLRDKILILQGKLKPIVVIPLSESPSI